MSNRMVLTALLAASLSAAQALALPTPFELTSPAARSGEPGQLVTLTFRVQGQGKYDLAVESPPDWVPVTPRAQLDVSGQTLFPVTFRIPAQAPVGKVPITLHAQQSGQDVMTAQASVEVQAKTRLSLSSPARIAAAPGVFLKIPVEVANLGNQTDTFDLTLENVDPTPQLSAHSVTLRPGERATVQVSLILSGVSPDYRYTTFVKATSRLDAAVVARTRSEAVFGVPAGARLGGAGAGGPSLVLRLRSEAQADYQQTDQGDQLSAHYGVHASADGQLSDKVDASASSELDGDVSGASGVSAPSALSVQAELHAARWSARAEVSTQGVSLGGSVGAGAWTLSPRAEYHVLGAAQRFGAGVDLSGPLAGGQLDATLQAQSTTLGNQTQRQESLGARYARALGPAIDFSVSALAQGSQTSSAPTPVTQTSPAQAQSPVSPDSASFGAQAAQTLTYRSGALDLTETYSVVTGGLQTFGVSGGLSSAAPVGLRAAATVQLTPRDTWYGVSGLAFYSGSGSSSGKPALNFGASIGGRYQFSAGAAKAAQWEVSGALAAPRVSLQTGAFGRLGIETTLRAALSSDDHSPGGMQRRLDLDVNLEGSAGRSAVQASAELTAQQDWTANHEQRQQLKLNLTSSYRLAENEFGAQVGAARVSIGGALETVYGAQVSWERQWTPQLSSSLAFSQSWQSGAAGRNSRTGAAVGVEAQDVLTRGLNLRASYRLDYASSQASPGTAEVTPLLTNPPVDLPGSRPLRQSAQLGVSYDLNLLVATPQAVVQAFGGLNGSSVSGVLYRDDNLSGLRDPGEPPLVGVTVQAGNQRSVTDARGEYHLQVSGAQVMSFPGGLSATLEPFGPPESRQLSGLPGSVERRDVAFANVGNVDVLAYQDLNHNGVYDDGEPGLPYVPVRLTGPGLGGLVTRTVQADSRGHARATLPLGHYAAALDLSSLPGLVAVSAVQTDVLVGAAGAGALQLGAGAAQPTAVLSYKSGAPALLARLNQVSAAPGDTVRLSVQLQGLDRLRVNAFGQDYAPVIAENQAELDVKVPSGSQPGVYDLMLSASGPGGQKSSTVRLILTAAATTPSGVSEP
ncbi:hypothetical protein [Deinococcus alpinitundrae]|uniref:hypothetical protein n=1 Tax=Deinococcus alpinitundrae TaxID=468913 RepID=UPI00137970E6|nr:hypothetical protein [Deinococcus alpinitundrae]